MLPGGKWVGLEFAVYVSFVFFFFLLVTTPGVIIKREFNSKTVSGTIPGEPITLD